MIHRLLDILLDLPAPGSKTVSATVFAVGVVLWLAGARFSRAIITLSLVTVGALVGMRLPRWGGWSIDPMGTGMGCAIALGAAGYLLHRTWVGLLLGSTLAAWALLAVRVGLGSGFHWNHPAIDWGGDPVVTGLALWRSVPPGIARIISAAAGSSMVGGIVLALLWPRVARVVLWTLLGLSLMVISGLPWVARTQPHWLGYLPAAYPAQVSSTCGAIGLGMVAQLWQLRKKKTPVLAAELEGAIATEGKRISSPDFPPPTKGAGIRAAA